MTWAEKNKTVENETVNNVSGLITDVKYHAINECSLLYLRFNKVNCETMTNTS